MGEIFVFAKVIVIMCACLAIACAALALLAVMGAILIEILSRIYKYTIRKRNE